MSPSSVLPRPFEQTPVRAPDCSYYPVLTSFSCTRQHTRTGHVFTVSVILYKRTGLLEDVIALVNPHIFITCFWGENAIVKGLLPISFKNSLYVNQNKVKLHQILGRACYRFGAALEVTRLLGFLAFVSC